MVRTHHELRGIVDSVCEAPSQPEKPFEVRKTSSGQSTFVKPWDRRFKQHSLEITCGVPVDWRLGNFNNVTLYIPPRPLSPKPLLSAAQSLKCEAKHAPCPSPYSTGKQIQQTGEVWGNPAPGRPWSAEERPLSLATAALTEGRQHPARRATAKQGCTGHNRAWNAARHDTEQCSSPSAGEGTSLAEEG